VREKRRARAVPHASRRSLASLSRSITTSLSLIPSHILQQHPLHAPVGVQGGLEQAEDVADLRMERGDEKKETNTARNTGRLAKKERVLVAGCSLFLPPLCLSPSLTSPVDRPVRPVRRPARETSMQGKPAVTRSMP